MNWQLLLKDIAITLTCPLWLPFALICFVFFTAIMAFKERYIDKEPL